MPGNPEIGPSQPVKAEIRPQPRAPRPEIVPVPDIRVVVSGDSIGLSTPERVREQLAGLGAEQPQEEEGMIRLDGGRLRKGIAWRRKGKDLEEASYLASTKPVFVYERELEDGTVERFVWQSTETPKERVKNSRNVAPFDLHAGVFREHLSPPDAQGERHELEERKRVAEHIYTYYTRDEKGKRTTEYYLVTQAEMDRNEKRLKEMPVEKRAERLLQIFTEKGAKEAVRKGEVPPEDYETLKQLEQQLAKENFFRGARFPVEGLLPIDLDPDYLKHPQPSQPLFDTAQLLKFGGLTFAPFGGKRLWHDRKLTGGSTLFSTGFFYFLPEFFVVPPWGKLLYPLAATEGVMAVAGGGLKKFNDKFFGGKLPGIFQYEGAAKMSEEHAQKYMRHQAEFMHFVASAQPEMDEKKLLSLTADRLYAERHWSRMEKELGKGKSFIEAVSALRSHDEKVKKILKIAGLGGLGVAAAATGVGLVLSVPGTLAIVGGLASVGIEATIGLSSAAVHLIDPLAVSIAQGLGISNIPFAEGALTYAMDVVAVNIAVLALQASGIFSHGGIWNIRSKWAEAKKRVTNERLKKELEKRQLAAQQQTPQPSQEKAV